MRKRWARICCFMGSRRSRRSMNMMYEEEVSSYLLLYGLNKQYQMGKSAIPHQRNIKFHINLKISIQKYWITFLISLYMFRSISEFWKSLEWSENIFKFLKFEDWSEHFFLINLKIDQIWRLIGTFTSTYKWRLILN